MTARTYQSAADCPLGAAHGYASTHRNEAGEDICDWCGFPADDEPTPQPTRTALSELIASTADQYGDIEP